jgi:anti-sigma factor RsiW
MMALSRKMLEQEPGEIELLLPWYAAGSLNPRDMKRVEQALASDPELARQYAVIQQEYAETIALNETLGAPSMRAMQKLFATIEAEPSQAPRRSRGIGARMLGFFGGLSPTTLAWSTVLGAMLVLAQTAIIAVVLLREQPATFQTASLDVHERASRAPSIAPLSAPLTRALGPQTAASPVHALVRFAPDARIADITALLNHYQAAIIDGAKGGMFTLQLGDRPMSKDEADGLIARLQREKIVSTAVATP